MIRPATWAARTTIAFAFTSAACAAVMYPAQPYASPGTSTGALLLDVYVPNPGVPMQPVTFVLVHGGSYNSGSRADLRPLALALADLGYPNVSIDYTLATETTPSFPQPVNDVMNAVRWVRTTGESFGLPNRVFLWGHSAGATIAMTAATSADRSVPTFTPHSDAPPVRGYVIDGIVGLSGRYDLVWNISVGVTQTVVQYVGAPLYVGDWRTAYATASAITYVGPCSPPTVLYHGSADTLVPLGNSTRLDAALQAAGVPVQLNIVPNGGHGPNIAGATWAQQAQSAANAAQWILQATTGTCGCIPLVPPTGACCPGDGTCAVTVLVDCPTNTGDGWTNGAACQPNPCPPVGACCVGGSCRVSQEFECGGAWFSAITTCSAELCEPYAVSGICCWGASCALVRWDQCQSAGATFTAGPGSCQGVGQARPCRVADFNSDGGVTIQDVLGYLGAWYLGDGAAATMRAPSRPTLQDLFNFLAAWYAG